VGFGLRDRRERTTSDRARQAPIARKLQIAGKALRCVSTVTRSPLLWFTQSTNDASTPPTCSTGPGPLDARPVVLRREVLGVVEQRENVEAGVGKM
jgi:hypothetical protein